MDVPVHAVSDFEREKWLMEVELRRRELDLKEREQLTRDAELEIRRREQAASKWRSPLVVAILAAAIAAGGNAVLAGVNGSLQRDLETRKRDADLRLENSKAESTRILEMIKTGSTEKAAGNLAFLLEAGLIVDADRIAKLDTFLKMRQPGGGPSLPAPDSRIAFEPTEALTQSVQGSMQKLLNDFIGYLAQVGFPKAPSRVKIKVENLSHPTAHYRDGTIVIDPSLSVDPSVPLREYGHHVLIGRNKSEPWANQYAAIESGLADYFACSFLNNPRLGELAANVYDPKRDYIRLLANDRKFTDFQQIRNRADMPYTGAEIWGGALWAIRAKLGRQTADPIVAGAWLSMTWPADEEARAAAFVAALLSVARSAGTEQLKATDEVLRARQFPIRR